MPRALFAQSCWDRHSACVQRQSAQVHTHTHTHPKSGPTWQDSLALSISPSRKVQFPPTWAKFQQNWFIPLEWLISSDGPSPLQQCPGERRRSRLERQTKHWLLLDAHEAQGSFPIWVSLGKNRETQKPASSAPGSDRGDLHRVSLLCSWLCGWHGVIVIMVCLLLSDRRHLLPISWVSSHMRQCCEERIRVPGTRQWQDIPSHMMTTLHEAGAPA